MGAVTSGEDQDARYWLTPAAAELLEALDQLARPHRPPEDLQ